MSDAGTGGVRPVKSAQHTIEVLEYLASRNDEPARMRDIGDDLGIPRSSLYALLRTLSDRGWVRRDSSGTLYTIGIRALMAGTSYIDSDPYLRAALPWLEELNRELDETVHYGRLDGTDVVYLATKESSQYLRYINRVGRRLPASVTGMGKAILADWLDVDLQAHLQTPLPSLTSHSLTDLDALRADLEETRRRGYSIDVEENSLGIRCFGFVLHSTSPATDAISCSVPSARLTPEREEKILVSLKRTVMEIERHLPRLTFGPVAW
ncbi:MAG: IclR family transcriptional regulator [Microbacterium sp.]